MSVFGSFSLSQSIILLFVCSLFILATQLALYHTPTDTQSPAAVCNINNNNNNNNIDTLAHVQPQTNVNILNVARSPHSQSQCEEDQQRQQSPAPLPYTPFPLPDHYIAPGSSCISQSPPPSQRSFAPIAASKDLQWLAANAQALQHNFRVQFPCQHKSAHEQRVAFHHFETLAAKAAYRLAVEGAAEYFNCQPGPTAFDLLPPSTMSCSLITDRADTSDEQLMGCEYQNIYFDAKSQRFVYYSPQRPEDAHAEASKSSFRPSSYFSLDVVASLPATNDGSPRQGVDRLFTRPIYLLPSLTANIYHSLMDYCFSAFISAHEYSNLTRFYDRSIAQFWLNPALMDKYPNNWDYYKSEPIDSHSPHYNHSGYGHLRSRSSTDSVIHHTPANPLYGPLLAAMSDLPLLTHRSFANGDLILIKRLFMMGCDYNRSPLINGRYNWSKFKLFPQVPFVDRQYSKWLLQFSEALLESLGLPSKFDLSSRVASDRLLIVSRASSTFRKFTNEAEFVSHVERLAIPGLNTTTQPVEFGPDLRANVLTARQARLAFGTHGAGLVYLIFMRPGGAYIEQDPPACIKMFEGMYAHLMRLSLLIPVQHESAFPPGDECSIDVVYPIGIEDVSRIMTNINKEVDDYTEATYIKAIKLRS